MTELTLTELREVNGGGGKIDPGGYAVGLVAAEDKVDPPGYGDPVRPDGALGGVVFLGS